MVKSIEHLDPELQCMGFRDQEVLVKAQSPGLIRRPDDSIPARVAVSERSRFRKDGFVEPAVGGGIINVGIPIEVWSLSDRTSSNVGDIAANADIRSADPNWP